MKVTRGNRLHIGFYGKRNVGKSTLFNLILGQNYSIVSDIAGTTTDVNQKSMELPPFGPVTLLDCAGVDDVEGLGGKRVEKALKTLNRVDAAVFVCDYSGLDDCDKDFLAQLDKMKIPYIIIANKTDIAPAAKINVPFIETNTHDSEFINKFKAELAKILPTPQEVALLPMVNKGDVAVLVTPIDSGAPAGRLILPQVQTLRNLLDENCISVVCQVEELVQTLDILKCKPKIVITDSQVFKKVDEIVPKSIALTSFSVIFANFKGDLEIFVQGAKKIDKLCNEDKILICESCTHHAAEDDIGRVKIPRLMQQYTGKKLIFEHYSGFDFPKNLGDYKLIIHCGACMTNRVEVLRRIEIAQSANIAITNYGIAIAKCLGILERAVAAF